MRSGFLENLPEVDYRGGPYIRVISTVADRRFNLRPELKSGRRVTEAPGRLVGRVRALGRCAINRRLIMFCQCFEKRVVVGDRFRLKGCHPFPEWLIGIHKKPSKSQRGFSAFVDKQWTCGRSRVLVLDGYELHIFPKNIENVRIR